MTSNMMASGLCGTSGQHLRSCNIKIENPLVEVGKTMDDDPRYCGHSATVWCALCYGRFMYSKTQPWLSRARIISFYLPDEITAQEGEVCISRTAHYDCGRMFGVGYVGAECDCGLSSYELSAYSTTFQLMDHDLLDSGDNETCHVPVHEACLELCERYPAKKPLNTEGPREYSNMAMLFRLALEYEEGCEEWCVPEILYEMQTMKADFGALQSFDWAEEDQIPAVDDLGAFVYDATCCNKVFDINPFDVNAKELTEFVLSLLQPLLLPRPSAKRGCIGSTDDCVGACLPTELLDMIESSLALSFVDPHPQPSGILAGSWWREALINKRLLPWLWDLDVDMIRKKASKPPKNWFGKSGTWVEWDWESLVRKLAQTQFWRDIDIHRVGEGAALALKNRRRIFLIMDGLARTESLERRSEEAIAWDDSDCPKIADDDARSDLSED